MYAFHYLVVLSPSIDQASSKIYAPEWPLIANICVALKVEIIFESTIHRLYSATDQH